MVLGIGAILYALYSVHPLMMLPAIVVISFLLFAYLIKKSIENKGSEKRVLGDLPKSELLNGDPDEEDEIEDLGTDV